MNSSRNRTLDSLLADVSWPVGLVARMIANSTYPAGRLPALSPPQAIPPPPGDSANAVPLIPPYDLYQAQCTVADLIVSRRSGSISEGSLDQARFGRILSAATEDLPLTLTPNSTMIPIVCPVVFNVEGLTPAAYRYVPTKHVLIPIRKVQRETVRDEVLLQWEHGTGAAILFLVVPMANWLHAFGDRGYRGVGFQIGWITDRLYLVAESLGLTYTASGGFSPALADKLLGLDGYHFTSFFSFVLGGAKLS